MPTSTPTRPLELSAKRLLKRVHMCTERSFERTPVRHTSSKRKIAPMLSTTFSSGITLLSDGDQTLVGDSTFGSYFTACSDRTITENNPDTKNSFNETNNTTPWEVLDSIHTDISNFSIITLNKSKVSNATVITKRSTKGTVRPSTLMTCGLKPAPKSLKTGVKFINRCVRDIDRLSDTFGQEWITLPNFV